MDNIISKNFHNKPVRIILTNGQELFFAKDIANILGYSNSRKAILDHCKNSSSFQEILESNDSLPLDLQPILGNSWKQTKLIQEPDIWRLIIKSKLPEAEKIEKWIFEEVSPTNP